MKIDRKLSKSNLWALTIGTSLSSAGSAISILALSTLLFQDDTSGLYSSMLQATTFLGVAFMGVFGGMALNKFKAFKIGILGPLLSSIILVVLLTLNSIPPFICIIAMFFLSCLYGLDHPNNLRVLNWNLDSKEKGSFFSSYQIISQTMTVLSPLVASVIISRFGLRWCFIIDIATYLLSTIPWFVFKNKLNEREGNKEISISRKDHWVGYHALLNNPEVRSLNIARILNNISYVSFSVGLPLFIAIVSKGDEILFAKIQGSVQSTISLGFILFGLIGPVLFKKHPQTICFFSYLASIFGLLAVVGGYFSISGLTLFISAFVLGCGQYCFRISGMTLGQAVTPPNILGQVIVAGDTVVRTASFIIGFAVPKIVLFSFSTSIPAILGLASLTLIAPFSLRNVYRAYKESLL